MTHQDIRQFESGSFRGGGIDRLAENVLVGAGLLLKRRELGLQLGVREAVALIGEFRRFSGLEFKTRVDRCKCLIKY